MEWESAAVVGLAILTVVVATGQAWYFQFTLQRLYSDFRVEALKREGVLVQMVKRLENRLSAKDLSGAMALDHHDTPQQEATPPMTDEYEAMLEQMRRGVIPMQGNGS